MTIQFDAMDGTNSTESRLQIPAGSGRDVCQFTFKETRFRKTILFS
jgi:hypothetical protein